MKPLRLWKERWALVLPAAVFLVGNVAFLLANRAIESSRAETMAGTREDLTRRVTQAEAEAQGAVGRHDRIVEVRRAVEIFYTKKIGPRRQMLAPIVAAIHRLTRSAQLVPKQISYSLDPVENLALTRLTIGFSVAGDYGAVRRLIRAFETDSHWLALTAIALAEEGEASGRTSIRLTAVSYFTEPEAARRPGARRAAEVGGE